MALTSQRRIPAAREFVRLGFGDTIDPAAPFYSHEFVTQELSTVEAQAVIPVVSQYNNFNGQMVAAGIGKFRGRVSGWKFGAAGSPLLLVVLAPWTHQLEDTSPGGKSGRKFTPEERGALIDELRALFIKELDAEKFEQDRSNESVYGAWWG
jgi:hypothetical protein